MARLGLIGTVTKVGAMAKTSTVTVTRFLEHPVTHKKIPRSKKYLTHDPEEACQLEDRVLIRHHGQPISARKRFVLESILDSPRAAMTAAARAEADSLVEREATALRDEREKEKEAKRRERAAKGIVVKKPLSSSSSGKEAETQTV